MLLRTARSCNLPPPKLLSYMGFVWSLFVFVLKHFTMVIYTKNGFEKKYWSNLHWLFCYGFCLFFLFVSKIFYWSHLYGYCFSLKICYWIIYMDIAFFNKMLLESSIWELFWKYFTEILLFFIENMLLESSIWKLFVFF